MNNQTLLEVSFDNDTGKYSINIPQSSNAAETAFCIALIIKCFNRDGVVPKDEMLGMIYKYLTDPQYEEIKGDTNDKQ